MANIRNDRSSVNTALARVLDHVSGVQKSGTGFTAQPD
jgi:hypothetical protein